jgi:MFS family permease
MTITHALDRLRELERPTQLFMAVGVLRGITLSVWILFFNIYILGLGFNHQFLGLINSMTAAAALVFGIPMGLLSDRIGRKKAMLLGIGIYTMASTMELLATERILLLALAFVSGVGGTLYFLNVAPFLMKVSKPETRTYLFSLNFSLVILAGVLGNLCAGPLLNLFSNLLQVQLGSPMIYRATLMAAVSLGYLEIILLILIRGTSFDEMDTPSIQSQKGWGPSAVVYSFIQLLKGRIVLKLAIVQVLFGFGVAMISPYINLLFHDKFMVADGNLGSVFALKALFTGLGSLMVPRIVRKFKGRIHVVSVSQLLGGIFVLVLGFSPILSTAVFGCLLGGVFLNTPIPLLNAFSMEQVAEQQRATLSSVREFAWQTGWVAGPYIAGRMLDGYGFTPLFVTSFVIISVTAILTLQFFYRHEKLALSGGGANVIRTKQCGFTS